MIYEITLRGYDSSTDKTDDLIKRVSASSEHNVIQWLVDNQLNAQEIEALGDRAIDPSECDAILP